MRINCNFALSQTIYIIISFSHFKYRPDITIYSHYIALQQFLLMVIIKFCRKHTFRCLLK